MVYRRRKGVPKCLFLGDILPPLVGDFLNILTYLCCISGAACYVIGMPRHSPFPIQLSHSEKRELSRRAAKYTLPYFEVIRARMILHAAEGLTNDEIARRLDTRREGGQLMAQALLHRAVGRLGGTAPTGPPPVFSPQKS